MKNIIITLTLFISGALGVQAQQIANNAIGLRIGGGNSFGTEISYQRALSSNNRLELNLGIEDDSDFDGFQASGIYQWVYALEDGFNWYVGPGAGLGNADYKNDDNDFFILAAGQVGIEYDFNFPLLLSLDATAEQYFGSRRDGFELGISLGVRYQF